MSKGSEELFMENLVEIFEKNDTSLRILLFSRKIKMKNVEGETRE